MEQGQEFIREVRTTRTEMTDTGPKEITYGKCDIGNPNLNEHRFALQQLIERRRPLGKPPLNKTKLASAIVAADSFAACGDRPRLEQRQNYAMLLRAAGLSHEEAADLAGLVE